jgi:hypothetical protein
MFACAMLCHAIGCIVCYFVPALLAVPMSKGGVFFRGIPPAEFGGKCVYTNHTSTLFFRTP